MDDFQSEIVPLYSAHSKQRCSEFALVLEAVGISCRVRPWEGKFALWVHAEDAARAREQLRLYRREHAAGSNRVARRLAVPEGLVTASLYGMAVLIVDTLQGQRAFALDWWQAGLSHAGLIRAGEWWRIVTALALHADTLHLAGNLAFGLVFGFLLGGVLGWGPALAGMLLAGALGNALAALVRPWDHTSVGASTAVFAMVGILATHAWTLGQRRFNRWVPLGGGVALLAFLGMSGERTDLVAHLTGFASGGLFGLLFALLEGRRRLAPWHTHALGIAAICAFAAAWAVALWTRG
ncbi:MAG: rhomboid family intramembrane serine protease [Rhodospirillales bacterium]|nr:MAG: rhomboid family intramembrane serine protease [Rhodospirillales bacterium]